MARSGYLGMAGTETCSYFCKAWPTSPVSQASTGNHSSHATCWCQPHSNRVQHSAERLGADKDSGTDHHSCQDGKINQRFHRLFHKFTTKIQHENILRYLEEA